MSVKDRDPLTGHQTTGHEWNGITELNTRVPSAIWWFILVTHVYALIAWVLLPTWPWINDYTKGLLGIDQRDRVERQVADLRAAREPLHQKLLDSSVADIRADPALSEYVAQTGPALFGDNCAVCHGENATGGPGYPSLVDDAWLWGGSPEAIMETLRVGINTDHPDTRFAQMLAFGGMLSPTEIGTVADYVRSLSGLETDAAPERLDAGQTLFAENCASCHGENATGSTDMGAPNLTDDFWIYGGDRSTVVTTISKGRQGWMPAWENRLDEADRKLLTVYLQDLKDAAQ